MAKRRGLINSPGLIFTLAGAFFVLLLSILLSKVNLNFRKAGAYSALSFPTDYGSHPSFNAEWWYLNLLTRTTRTDGTDQKDLAYILSFSRILGSNNLLSSRYDNTSKSFKESTEQAGSLVVQLKDSSRLFVQFSKGLVLTTLEELVTGSDRKKVYHLTGKTANMGSFDLTLKERTVVSSGYNTPLLWGGTTGNCQGKISVFGQDDTFYYSIPDLDITGTITDVDGVKRNVSVGKAWMDHQWFNSSPPNDWKGHYWTNFHFTNSSDLYSSGPHQAFGFVMQIYSSGPKYTYWVKRNANGTNECGTSGSIVIKSYGSTSYPNSWNVSYNNGYLGASGYSFSDNQIYQPPMGPKFIEAASYYSGNLNGIPFTGLGFFETHLTRSSATPTPTLTPGVSCTRRWYCTAGNQCTQTSSVNGFYQNGTDYWCGESLTTPVTPTRTCAQNVAEWTSPLPNSNNTSCYVSQQACINSGCATPTPTPTPTRTLTPTPTRTPTPTPLAQCNTPCNGNTGCPVNLFCYFDPPNAFTGYCRKSNCPQITNCLCATPTLTPNPTPTGEGVPGDVNGDGAVNIIDIGILIDNYGLTPPTGVRTDLNKDGIVNIIDIGIVIDNYGK